MRPWPSRPGSAPLLGLLDLGGAAPGRKARLPAPVQPDTGNSEKHAAALNSVAAAFFLTALKVIVGLVSGSLGILAEAAHSGLDFLAAIITYVAVRAAGKPPDREHAYGHGKIENLSAMAETLLLLATCAWIITEAVHRLTVEHAAVHASFWAFAVMAVSIIVDVSRSRMLYRVAAKHRSQALEADALHFSTDIWSSAVVILGLGCVKIAASYPGLAFLEKADSVAALIVAAIVVVVSLRLGFRTIQGLLDASPAGAAEQIQARVEKLEHVLDCHAVRVRHSGPFYFVDLHITLDGDLPLRTAHEVTERVEAVVAEIYPGADVVVHPEPRNVPPPPPAPARPPGGAAP
jgi:cation diffusion facilitator family transporter